MLRSFMLGVCLVLFASAFRAATPVEPRSAGVAINDCAICLSPLNRDILDVCKNSHKLHRSCAQELSRYSLTDCPICRAPLRVTLLDEDNIFVSVVCFGTVEDVRAYIQNNPSCVDQTYLDIPPLFDAIGRYAAARTADEQIIAMRICRLLLAAGAKVNEGYTQTKFTALHMAAFYGLSSICGLLSIYGANYLVRTKYGATPAQIALRNGHRELAEDLRSD